MGMTSQRQSDRVRLDEAVRYAYLHTITTLPRFRRCTVAQDRVLLLSTSQEDDKSRRIQALYAVPVVDPYAKEEQC